MLRKISEKDISAVANDASRKSFVVHPSLFYEFPVDHIYRLKIKNNIVMENNKEIFCIMICLPITGKMCVV